MDLSAQVAKHLRELYFGGNWTTSNLRDQLVDVSFHQATTTVHSLNTIATLFYHINYYVTALIKVLEGGPLDASDKYSFAHPTLNNESDWQAMLNNAWVNAEHFAHLIAQMPENKLWEDLPGNKYGHFYRNFHGLIEHGHYHLGQIVLIKKILSTQGIQPAVIAH